MVADNVSDQFGTVESVEADDEAFVKGRSRVTRTQSEGDLNLNDQMDWPMSEKIEKGRRNTLHVGWNTNYPI